MSVKYAVSVALFGLTTLSATIQADPIVFEGFTGYPDDALISDSPAGPAIGLTGDWQLDPENFFYVNMTEADPEAGSDQAVYDMPWDDNGARTAQRVASPEHALFLLPDAVARHVALLVVVRPDVALPPIFYASPSVLPPQIPFRRISRLLVPLVFRPAASPVPFRPLRVQEPPWI